MKSKEKCCTLENITNYALKQAINFYTIHFHSQKSPHGSEYGDLNMHESNKLNIQLNKLN